MCRIMGVVVGVLICFPVLVAAQEKGRGQLGITLEDADHAVVASVQRGSAAAEMKMKPGDRILSINGKKTATLKDITGLLKTLSAGDEIVVAVTRGEDELELTGELKAVSPASEGKEVEWEIEKWGNLKKGETPPSLASLHGKVVVLFCFQSW